ncbi:nitrilase-related carbon-nitrogen hydrolase [Terrihabitans sp. B22-R8]|uniref:nitrilase-related carbon-nitrogen hydrolase n=1 Tax=Terrihabitans sp. B22-R8 TaxID=3425128 RepID=UPI00403C79B9
MTKKFKAAAVQFEPSFGNKSHNVSALLRLAEEAAEQGARLICTPEMGTTGYCWYDRAEIAPHVEPIPGPTTQLFAELASLHDCYLVVGMPEVDPETGLYYNSAVLIGRDGVIGVHRKTHPYISEPKWAAAGDLGHRVFETEIGRISLLICMDVHFFETARLAALEGADVICHISNWLAERTPAPYWISRAFENGCYLIESNRWGFERGVQFSGGTCIIAPDATILDVIDRGDGIAYAEIDPALARARTIEGETVLHQRRPELYMELLTNAFVWNPTDFFGLYGHNPLPKGRASSIAVAQFAPRRDMEMNLTTIGRLAEEVAASGAELVVFPELALTGLDDPAATAIATDDPAIKRLTALAARLGLVLVVGLAERAGGNLHNTAILVGPRGMIGSYRKIHLSGADRLWAEAGHEWSVIDLPFGRAGILIGHDLSFPESARVLALKGCDLLLCPSAVGSRFHNGHPGTEIAHPRPIPTVPDPLHWHQGRVRAGENNCYLAFANISHEAEGYAGLSGIFGPNSFHFPRKENVAGGEEGFVIGHIDTGQSGSASPANVVRRKDVLLRRLPHHYTSLIHKHSPSDDAAYGVATPAASPETAAVARSPAALPPDPNVR